MEGAEREGDSQAQEVSERTSDKPVDLLKMRSGFTAIDCMD